MKFYIQIASDKTITDIITYPHDGYHEIELEFPLLHAYHDGTWRLINGELTKKEYPVAEQEAAQETDA